MTHKHDWIVIFDVDEIEQRLNATEHLSAKDAIAYAHDVPNGIPAAQELIDYARALER